MSCGGTSKILRYGLLLVDIHEDGRRGLGILLGRSRGGLTTEIVPVTPGRGHSRSRPGAVWIFAGCVVSQMMAPRVRPSTLRRHHIRL